MLRNDFSCNISCLSVPPASDSVLAARHQPWTPPGLAILVWCSTTWYQSANLGPTSQPQQPAAAAKSTPSMEGNPGSFPLLDLPPPALVSVFSHLIDLRNAVSLSCTCKELWALGAAARRRRLCCAACGHAAVSDAAAAFRHGTQLSVDLPDGPDSYAFDVQHVQQGCALSTGTLRTSHAWQCTLPTLGRRVH